MIQVMSFGALSHIGFGTYMFLAAQQGVVCKELVLYVVKEAVMNRPGMPHATKEVGIISRQMRKRAKFFRH